jgi:DNA-binding GntR family transcriptional regulator
MDREPEKLVNHLVEQIQSKIASGEYAPGAKLRQAALATAFQVSRTPIRQALTQLAARGFVDESVAGGVIVKTQTPKEVRDLYRVRAEIEGLAAELAAHWITDRALRELRQIHERFVGAVSLLHESAKVAHDRAESGYEAVRKEWVVTNSEFHAVINRASCNDYVCRLIGEMHLDSARGVIAASALGMYRHRMERNIQHHEAVLQALEARDPAKARAAMATHVLESGEFVAAWLENNTRT